MPGRSFLLEKKRGGRRTGSRWLGRVGELLLYTVLFCSGVVGVWLVTARLILPEWEANRRFVQGTCRVESKRVGETKDQLRFRPEITITYEVGDRRYESVTYDAVFEFTSNRDDAEEKIAEFVVGGTYRCWYDPRNPANVVVVRGYSIWPWVALLVPISFVALGGTGLGASWLNSLASRERLASFNVRERLQSPANTSARSRQEYLAVPPVEDINNSPGTELAYRLPIDVGTTWRIVAEIAVTLVWNGMVTALAVVTFRGQLQGAPFWVLVLGLLPVAGLGVALLYRAARQLLYVNAAGTTRLEVSGHPFRPGGLYNILLAQAGRLRLRTIEVLLVCEERATFRQGTDTQTSQATVFDETVYRGESIEVRPEKPFEDRFNVAIPDRAMHSLRTDHNEIAWSFLVRGQPERLPNFERRFPVCVYPPQLSSLPDAVRTTPGVVLEE